MKIMYLDDELAARKRFEYYMDKLMGDYDVTVIENPLDALAFARENDVDVAILDIEMPGMSGLLVAEKLGKIDRNIRIIFITGFSQYAMDAFQVDAFGYLTKPYTLEALKKELDKVSRIGKFKDNRIYIQTMPSFEVYLDGEIVPLAHNKQRELLALMVDKRGRSMTVGEIIAFLWEDKPDDEKTKSLVRMTFKRLRETLHEYQLENILNANLNMRAINPEAFSCDYYRILEGNKTEIAKYKGSYMEEYVWSEETNATLDNMIGYRLR